MCSSPPTKTGRDPRNAGLQTLRRRPIRRVRFPAAFARFFIYKGAAHGLRKARGPRQAEKWPAPVADLPPIPGGFLLRFQNSYTTRLPERQRPDPTAEADLPHSVLCRVWRDNVFATQFQPGRNDALRSGHSGGGAGRCLKELFAKRVVGFIFDHFPQQTHKQHQKQETMKK